MRHYELFFFYISGFKPVDCIRLFGYSRATAYRMHKSYQNSKKAFQEVLKTNKTIPLKRENKPNNLDV